MQLYDPPYAKKPMPKKFTGKGPPPNHSAEEAAAMESVNKILTFGNMPSYSRQDAQRVLFRPVNHSHMAATSGMSTARLQEHKMQQLKRLGASSGSEEDAGISGEEESVSFIDLPPNSMSKLPEKGILKKSGPYGTVESKDKWSEDSEDNQEMMSSSDNNLVGEAGPIIEVERTIKSLNGYHEDILEALRTAATHRSIGGGGPSASGSIIGGPSGLSSEELRKSLPDACYPEYASDFTSSLLKSSQEKLAAAAAVAAAHQAAVAAAAASAGDSGDEDTVPPCGTIRIRNLEDLIRQLEHHSSRHMSPSGSEDIRMSETEADRHYRLDTEGGQPRDDDPRFVFGRYRQPTGGPGSGAGPSNLLRRPPQPPGPRGAYREEEIYESADPDRGDTDEAHDSGSDEFIQAQHLVRSASEEALPVTVKRGTHGDFNHEKTQCETCELYPSPPSDEEESYPGSLDELGRSASSAMGVANVGSPVPVAGTSSGSYSRLSASDESRESSRDAVSSAGTEETALIHPTRYPEYKH